MSNVLYMFFLLSIVIIFIFCVQLLLIHDLKRMNLQLVAICHSAGVNLDELARNYMLDELEKTERKGGFEDEKV